MSGVIDALDDEIRNMDEKNRKYDEMLHTVMFLCCFESLTVQCEEQQKMNLLNADVPPNRNETMKFSYLNCSPCKQHGDLRSGTLAATAFHTATLRTSSKYWVFSVHS
ncbi:unnamed protein product [Gongylonema pulchrum]|uniref:Uncharacterized protein n=1 Tax=Gongylonema pulchrum TaxID=637853 RepID=A0A3P6R8J8_9BILA|nr:unnamed protein product [Gongylonema pulchrum]